MSQEKKNKLGKGLSALIKRDDVRTILTPGGEIPASFQSGGGHLLFLPPREIRPNPRQPRRVFNEEALEELAESLKKHGMQEPVIVRKADNGYELVCGERRCRAAVLADLPGIPALCRDVSDDDMLKLGLIENIQREDLNAVELAQAYRQLLDEFHWTQEQLAEEVGKKRATVANTLRLLQLPEVIQDQVADGSLSMGHARALLALPTVQAQIALARKIVQTGLSVRQAEHFASQSATKPAQKRREVGRDPHVMRLEERLRRSLGSKVMLRTQEGGRGRIEIEYYSLDELDRLLALITGSRNFESAL